MKAAICRAFGTPLSIEDVTLAPPQKKQVRIKVAACAICHSDIAFMDGIWNGALPAVYGHEAAGHIVELGKDVRGFDVGDRVIITLIRSCGDCHYCNQGHPTNCEDPYDRMQNSPLRDSQNNTLEHGMATAAFAEEVVVDQSQIIAIPDSIKMDVACLLACGVITGYGAVTNSAKMPIGATAVIIGAGGVGLNTIQACHLNGASKVIAIDLSKEKLISARDFGATDTLIADHNLRDDIRSLTNGRGADFVFITVGAIQAFESAPDLLAPHGQVIMVGMPPIGKTATYEPVNLVAANQTIKGSKMGETLLSRDIPDLLSQYHAGALKLDELITKRYDFKDINQAITDTRNGTTHRNVIIFNQAYL